MVRENTALLATNTSQKARLKKIDGTKYPLDRSDMLTGTGMIRERVQL